MKAFLIQSSLFINLVVLAGGCAIRNYGLSDFKNTQGVNPGSLNPVLPDTFSTVLFKAGVDVYGRYFSGLLFIKAIDSTSSYRLIMTTETGLQLFDLELMPDRMIIHACMEKMNRKAVMKIIESDFRLLLEKYEAHKAQALLTDKARLHTVYRFRDGKKLTYFFIENKTGYLDRIERASPWYKKVTVLPEPDENAKPNTIRFMHHDARLEIKLKLLKIS